MYPLARGQLRPTLCFLCVRRVREVGEGGDGGGAEERVKVREGVKVREVVRGWGRKWKSGLVEGE